MEENLRAIIKARDGIDNEEFDDLLAEFKEFIEAGEDPEDALHDIFGIEPDFLFDQEIMKVMG